MVRRLCQLSTLAVLVGCGTTDLPGTPKPSLGTRARWETTGSDPAECARYGLAPLRTGQWTGYRCGTGRVVNPASSDFGPAVPPSGDAPGVHVNVGRVSVIEMTPGSIQIGGGK